MAEENVIRKWSEKWYNSKTKQEQRELMYQLSIPCHFVMTVNQRYAVNRLKYRNIDDELLYNGDERICLNEGYVGDVVIDKYIRDYGGEEGVYCVKETTEEVVGNGWDNDIWAVHTFEISNENTKLNVMWSGNTSLVCVYIEDTELEEVTEYEKMSYIYWEDLYGNFEYSTKGDTYWLLIDKKFQQKEYHYRNVDPSAEVEKDSTMQCDERGYYIADEAIDKYIRDYGGKNSLYNVELIEREEDEENGEYRYALAVENVEDPEEQMQIEYSDADWLVTVKVPDGRERVRAHVLGIPYEPDK